MSTYEMRTVVGGGLAIFVGGSVVTFEVRAKSGKESVLYTLYGVDFGFGAGKGGVQGPSAWTTFDAPYNLFDFHGYVTLVSVGSTVGVGGAYMKLDFITGPAAGASVSGLGVVSGLGMGLTATHGYMKRAS